MCQPAPQNDGVLFEFGELFSLGFFDDDGEGDEDTEDDDDDGGEDADAPVDYELLLTARVLGHTLAWNIQM